MFVVDAQCAAQEEAGYIYRMRSRAYVRVEPQSLTPLKPRLLKSN